MKKFLTILLFTAVAFIAVYTIDELSFSLGITDMFSDQEHYDYWFYTRLVVGLVWLASCLLVVGHQFYTATVFKFALGVSMYVIAALMFAVFIFIMIGIIELPVEGIYLGVILIAYLMGIIGVTVMAGNLMKKYMDLLDEQEYQEEVTEFLRTCESEIKD